MQRITEQHQLRALAKSLGMREGWHEPDEQDVTAVVKGNNFDNAGFWPEDNALIPRQADDTPCKPIVEKHVIIRHQGKPVAAVNLATLLGWASEPVDD